MGKDTQPAKTTGIWGWLQD